MKSMDSANYLRCYFILILFIISSLPAIALNNFPYGCHIYYNGAERIYTDYLSTDQTQSRHYSSNIVYTAGSGQCEVTFGYYSIYPGGCTVEGINTGQNVTITSVENCPLDDIATFSVLIGGVLGVFFIRKTLYQSP